MGQYINKMVPRFEARQIDTSDYDRLCELVKWCNGRAIDQGDYVIQLPHGGRCADTDWIVRTPTGGMDIVKYRFDRYSDITFKRTFSTIDSPDVIRQANLTIHGKCSECGLDYDVRLPDAARKNGEPITLGMEEEFDEFRCFVDNALVVLTLVAITVNGWWGEPVQKKDDT